MNNFFCFKRIEKKMVSLKLKVHLFEYKFLAQKITWKIRKNQQWNRYCCSHHSQQSQDDREVPENRKWNVLFFGTDEFALESLKKLCREYRSNRLLNRLEAVTSYEGKENALIKYAKEHGIKVHHWPLKTPILDFDIGLVVSFGHLIPSRVIKSFPLGMINVHASLLPRWRGASPIVYALMNGDERTGVTIMKIAPKKFDIGEILLQREIDIGPHEVQPELHKRLAEAGGDLLIETIEKLPNVIYSGKAQTNENVTHAPKITKDISIVHWNEMTAKQVYNLQRALTGIFPLKTTFQGKSMKIFGIKLAEKRPDDPIDTKTNPGIVFYNKEKRLLMVQCKRGDWVTIDGCVVVARKRMTAEDFNNGYIKNRWDKVIIFGDERDEKLIKSVCE